MKQRLKAFVKQFSDAEIQAQLSDLFSFTKLYKQALLEERDCRARSAGFGAPAYDSGAREPSPCGAGPDGAQDAYEGDETPDAAAGGAPLDYFQIEKIRRHAANLTLDELLAALETLSGIDADMLAWEEREILEVEKQLCDERLRDIAMKCPNCGKYIMKNTAFCGKCGFNINYVSEPGAKYR